MPTYKNDKGWYASFYYTDWMGQRKKKKKEGFKTQREAKEYERNFLSKEQGSPDMLFSDLYGLFMEDCKARLKFTTLIRRKSLCESQILPYFEKMQVNKITPAAVRKWQNELLGKGLKQTYLRAANTMLNIIFGYGVKYCKLPSNPASVCRGIGKTKKDKVAFWTLDEFRKFMEYPHKLTYKVIFELLYWTGMRIGELLALTKADFDFDAKIVSVSKSYFRHGKNDYLTSPKTEKSIRTIAISDFLIELVKEYMDKLYEYEDTDRLIQTDSQAVRRHMIKAADDAGIKQIRIHDLRHSHASLLIELGFSPLLISERLGHESIQTTLNTYSHLYPNKQSELADKLQDLHD